LQDTITHFQDDGTGKPLSIQSTSQKARVLPTLRNQRQANDFIMKQAIN